MLSTIIATLRLAVVPLTIVESLLRSVIPGEDDALDKVADGLKEGIRLILGVTSQFPETTESGAARGLVAISNFCRGVLARLEQILIDVQTDEAAAAPDNPLKAEARALVDSLSDESKVYQAKRGDDAQVLSDAKSAAAEKLTAILAS